MRPYTPASRSIDVPFRLLGNPEGMTSIELTPVRTSGGAVVLGVTMLGPMERLRRFFRR